MVDNESKYLYNGFPYLGKDKTKDILMSVPTNVVMKPLFKHGYNVTCNNFFTSLDVAARLAKGKCSLVGYNGRKLPRRSNIWMTLHCSKLPHRQQGQL